MTKNSVLILLVLVAMLAACAQPESAETPAATEPAATAVQVVEEVDSAEIEPTQPSAAAIPEATATDEPTATAEPVIEPITVTYFTPAQQEGPYYTVDKPADRDNDLVALASATGIPAGTVLEFGGKVYDATGMPLTGVVIEIWQTDANGAYLHPRDPATDNRDLNFQFYGEATTQADGTYQFRTIVPGKYEPRPVHIHVKVKAGGQELLTTQFYFAGDPALAGEGLTGGDSVYMIMAVADGVDAAGNPILFGERDIVLRQELAQYYPDVAVQDGVD
jgi:protocatechuate 3,4-dioxygenase beta subunit